MSDFREQVVVINKPESRYHGFITRTKDYDKSYNVYTVDGIYDSYFSPCELDTIEVASESLQELETVNVKPWRNLSHVEGAVTWNPDQEMDHLLHDPDRYGVVGDALDNGIGGFPSKQCIFDAAKGRNWVFNTEELRIINYKGVNTEMTTKMNTAELYEGTEHGKLCGETLVRKCQRRKGGEEQYSIQYAGGPITSGSVKRKDIPAVVAALLDCMEDK